MPDALPVRLEVTCTGLFPEVLFSVVYFLHPGNNGSLTPFEQKVRNRAEYSRDREEVKTVDVQSLPLLEVS